MHGHRTTELKECGKLRVDGSGCSGSTDQVALVIRGGAGGGYERGAVAATDQAGFYGECFSGGSGEGNVCARGWSLIVGNDGVFDDDTGIGGEDGTAGNCRLSIAARVVAGQCALADGDLPAFGMDRSTGGTGAECGISGECGLRGNDGAGEGSERTAGEGSGGEVVGES